MSALWLVLAACTGGQTGDESTGGGPDASEPSDAGGSDASFFDSLRQGFGNYDAAHSVEELAERSERIAVGTLAGVRPGHTRVERSDVGPSTAVMELAVSEVLKGEPAERLYVELYVGDVFDAARLPEPLPENRLLVFLVPSESIDAGIPDGEVLYWPTTPQGFMVEDGSGQVDAVDLVLAPISFDDLVGRLRDQDDADAGQ